MSKNMLNIKNDDLIFSTSNGQILSGDFVIDSSLLQDGISPMLTMNSEKLIGDSLDKNVSSMFHHLAFPTGLLYLSAKRNSDSIGGGGPTGSISSSDNNYKAQINNKDEMLNDDIHEHFLKIMEISKKTKHNSTRKSSKKKSPSSTSTSSSSSKVTSSRKTRKNI